MSKLVAIIFLLQIATSFANHNHINPNQTSDIEINYFDISGLQNQIKFSFKKDNYTFENNQDQPINNNVFVFYSFFKNSILNKLNFTQNFQGIDCPQNKICGNVELENQIKTYYFKISPINTFNLFKENKNNKQDQDYSYLEKGKQLEKMIQEKNKKYNEMISQKQALENIRNKCFMQCSNYFYIFVPISQIIEQKTIDQIIVSNHQKKDKTFIVVIHIVLGVYNETDFKNIVNLTATKKYPLYEQTENVCTDFEVDGCEKIQITFYRDLRDDKIMHFFFADVESSFSFKNQIYVSYLNQLKQSLDSIDFGIKFADCLHKEGLENFEISLKKTREQNSSENKIYEYNQTQKIIQFNTQFYNFTNIKEYSNQQKQYVVYEDRVNEIQVLVYLPGFIKVVDYSVKPNILGVSYLIIIFENDLSQYESEKDSQTCYPELRSNNLNQGQFIQEIKVKDKKIITKKKDIKYEYLEKGEHKFTFGYIQ